MRLHKRFGDARVGVKTSTRDNPQDSLTLEWIMQHGYCRLVRKTVMLILNTLSMHTVLFDFLSRFLPYVIVREVVFPAHFGI